ncbi:MAG: glycine dehydrogenase (decarboxylating) [Acidimicrobiia bacterium]|nr:MAG: glycine dehydrogenase (decarboxylating) [Acidimicrobiia bacterium]
MSGPSDFVTRHIGPRPDDIPKMLSEVGVESLEALIDEAVPRAIRLGRPLHLPEPMTEPEVLARLSELAALNRPAVSLIGMGYHGTYTPPVILRNVLENPAWYTAYTPYQPEISQGRLEALLNFQTMVEDLTGLDVANASLLDEASAAAEAMAMCRRVAGAGRGVFLVDRDCHPQTIEVVRTRAEPTGVEIVVGDPASFEFADAFGMLLQWPGSSGRVPDYRPLVDRARRAGVTVVVASDPLALVMLEPPGSWGADVMIGSTQRFGVPLWFGGPHAAYIACREEHVRALPGRLVGVSRDRRGRIGLRLALQTREQHIRRERATSNVCTAQVLLAIVAGLYACWHGPEGLRRIARRVHELTGRLAAGLGSAGFEVENPTFFDTITVRVPGRADDLVSAAAEGGIDLRRVDPDRVGIALDETTDEETLSRLLSVFGVERLADQPVEGVPKGLERRQDFLTHPVFNSYHSEHEMLRYLRRLADRDLALDRTMIPLGSCTMKLNPTAAMIPITWRGFTDLHPFSPLDRAKGYRELIAELEGWLAEITGFDVVSLQPNAGSQGELAGLLAIRNYHRAKGRGERDVCLIPASAHGTNAASAAMAGMRVVVVACDDHGNVDLDDLEEKTRRYSDRVAAAMVTYPSTHGVFEAGISELCRIVHSAGGQVYVDGANLNAMMGIARPGDFGADVCHLNLHKTFTIPHGGGGPGVGPVAAKAHLAPFLPGHPLVGDVIPGKGGPVAAAPWGSAGILPIAWAYIAMMGASGLRRASEVAVLAANYVAARLAPHYPVLYRGEHGRVAHECILDIRPITRASGITAEDIAKRLADYQIHAPTLSFPVAGTLMVEPTESEPLGEIDRFCEAMISIRAEIRKVEEGIWPRDDNPLVNAPHPAEDLISEGWDHPYSREEAAYPVESLRGRMYFPPVGRIDAAAGDRNLICSCPPLSDYVGRTA